jgi:hypothetical protein
MTDAPSLLAYPAELVSAFDACFNQTISTHTKRIWNALIKGEEIYDLEER